MWTTNAIIGWLSGLGITIPLRPGTARLDSYETLDRVGIVTPISGPGLFLEGVADVKGFQLRVRGRQHDEDDAETLALDADQRILHAPTPATVGTTQLLSVSRTGSGPTPLSPTPDDGERTEFVCNYLTRIMEVTP